ncbi:MAG: adenosylcobinamide-GDP ribazoletransferase [Spirochaetaceae bacterium]|nr:MAG: adenosylcobinamide-GDP ribazoletransferase [Spirochaetaceae bacterium]
MSSPVVTQTRKRFHELRVFLSAVMFYTRIPVKYELVDEDGLLQKATRYLPLIGLMVGAVSALGFYLVSFVAPAGIAAVVAMTLAVLMTGAFHEDGFVDTCDGFGGGWTVEQTLSIMKDSRIGTYGGIGLFLSLLLRFLLIAEIAHAGTAMTAATAIVLSHSLGRLVPVYVIAASSYVRLDETSKVKPVAKGVSVVSVGIATIVAAAIVFGLTGLWTVAFAAPAAALVLALMCRVWFHRHIGGYTGDTLGAAEQIGELAVLAVLVVLPQVLHLTWL